MKLCLFELKRTMMWSVLLYLFAVSIFTSQFALVLSESQSETIIANSHIIQEREGDQVVTALTSNTTVTPKINPVPSDTKVESKTDTTSTTITGITPSETKLEASKLNCSLEYNKNKTECVHSENKGYGNSLLEQMSENKDMLLRTLYVTLGITGIIVVYFVARAVWLRKGTKSRKYRIIAQNGDLEMQPLGDGKDDDDEDYTVFEVNGKKK